MNGDDPGVIEKIARLLNNFLSTVNGLVKVAFSFALVLLIVANFTRISNSVGLLADRMPDVAKISAGDLSIELNSASIGEKIKSSALTAQLDRDHWGEDQSKNAARGVKALDRRSLMRLMNVGLLHNVCRYPNPTVSMSFDYAIDQSLKENGLAQIIPNRKTLEDVLATIREKEQANAAKPFSLGRPIECYDVVLTASGYDVRTWVSHWLVAHFDPVAAVEEAGK
jgi:hypothetical protein